MTNVVTAKEVYDLSGLSVDHELVAKAQLVVATSAGFPLSDAAKFADLSDGDRYHLKTAVVWQVVYLDKHPEALAGEYLANVVSASANGASITLRGDTDGTLAGLAAKELEALSWRRQSGITVGTLRPYRRTADGHRWVTTTETDNGEVYANRGPQPDPWATL